MKKKKPTNAVVASKQHRHHQQRYRAINTWHQSPQSHSGAARRLTPTADWKLKGYNKSWVQQQQQQHIHTTSQIVSGISNIAMTMICAYAANRTNEFLCLLWWFFGTCNVVVVAVVAVIRQVYTCHHHLAFRNTQTQVSLTLSSCWDLSASLFAGEVTHEAKKEEQRKKLETPGRLCVKRIKNLSYECLQFSVRFGITVSILKRVLSLITLQGTPFRKLLEGDISSSDYCFQIWSPSHIIISPSGSKRS